MRRTLTLLAGWLARHPYLALMLGVAIAAPLGIVGASLEVDPRNEALFLADDPAHEGQDLLREHFGGDLFCLVALEGEIFSEEGLYKVESITEGAAAIEGVESVVSLTNAKDVFQGPLELYAFAPYEWYLDDAKPGPDGLDQAYGEAQLRADLLAEPLFANNLVASSGRMAAVLVTLTAGAPEEHVVKALRALAASEQSEGFKVHVAGFPVERSDFARLIRDDQARFVPLVLAMLALVTFLLFRQAWGVALPLLCVGMTLAMTRGVAALAGVQLNAVTSLLTPVIMVVSVAVSVNLCIAYTQERESAGVGVPGIRAAFERVGLACLFTTLTTMLGFLGLTLSKVPAIRAFGALSATGVALSYLAALLLLPALFGLTLRWGPRTLRARPGGLERVLLAVSRLVLRARFAVIGASVLLIALAGAGIAKLRVETDILAQLPADSDLAEATVVIGRELGGVNVLDLLLV
ncbi:MAG: efflux RND transporter permease subunit, partial [Planctomycetota bacterium]